MRHAIINAMKCMRAIKGRISRPVNQLENHLSQASIPRTMYQPGKSSVRDLQSSSAHHSSVVFRQNQSVGHHSDYTVGIFRHNSSVGQSQRGSQIRSSINLSTRLKMYACFGCCGCVVGRQNCAGRDLLRSMRNLLVKSDWKFLPGCEGERRYRTPISLLVSRRVAHYHTFNTPRGHRLLQVPLSCALSSLAPFLGCSIWLLSLALAIVAVLLKGIIVQAVTCYAPLRNLLVKSYWKVIQLVVELTQLEVTPRRCTCVTLNGSGIQLAVGPQPLRLRNHNFGLAHRIMVKSLATSPHDPLGITDSACKNHLVMVSVQYGPFNTYIPIRSTTIGKSRVARDPITMHTSWRSHSDITSVTRQTHLPKTHPVLWPEIYHTIISSDSIGYPRIKASGESSTTKHRPLHASGPHPIPPPNDTK
ncbi:hypothetical protein F511_09795 [Dorcoceras hygrometricum]|uniref:Uncharacterized protein n=1 Tax=Dorcoceras hygrometricum TaxID=472368 RepID=A0A2Z7C126_9LAMI|nr:hypothetical protein F511_09795 [Dorcoceras hygrometricum]